VFQLISGIGRHTRDDQGQALVEYALILTFVALVTVTVLGSVGQSLIGPFTAVANGL
jgi:Flp pilus assembly pilin Flp